MPKTKRKGERLGGYFRRVFEENPQWLSIRSNDLMKARFEADHPGRVFSTTIRSNMANVKSVMRKKLPGRRKGSAGRAKSETGLMGLEGLEIAIDRCLSSAREIDPEGLEAVIRSLRTARNQVVWKMGEP